MLCLGKHFCKIPVLEKLITGLYRQSSGGISFWEEHKSRNTRSQKLQENSHPVQTSRM